ncbi:winged helix DNA-binding domain-containing protein [Actinotalea sp. BY-33]|uniref:Winged helix DNA-binding domain-containing protein n=1 Tax=Actinotalea soli TaxID=2819234 RepID=A0A939LS32_9CELL|nr:crosslink repair DNA glycosylase YcaQ family protein [Actinotalea soli]MBO1752030.1 winged helix DNA-binding domain-containing protein [Actinotalea soli]
MTTTLPLSREQVMAHRRRVGVLDERLPSGPEARHQAAAAGLTDSGPRAALLSLHARVEGTRSSDWEAPGLVQLWGPRFSAYVIAEEDRATFSLGRLPTRGARRELAEDLAERLDAVLRGREMPYGEAGRAVGVHHNQLRYAALTGRVLIRWDGARQPTVRCVPPPPVDTSTARLDLARRYLHVMGPGTAEGFGRWAGLHGRSTLPAFEALGPELLPVRTVVGEGWILAGDEASLRSSPGPAAAARLLPSGDSYTLFWGPDRELLVPDAGDRAALWTPRVWPGAVLVGGEVVGTWRRAEEKVTVTAFRALTAREREAVEEEAVGLPLPGLTAPISVRWS